MRQAAGHLSRQFAATCLLQSSAGLGFLGDVHGQDVNAPPLGRFSVRGERDADTALAVLIGEFKDRRVSTKSRLEMRLKTRVCGFAERLIDQRAHNIPRPPRHDRGEASV